MPKTQSEYEAENADAVRGAGRSVTASDNLYSHAPLYPDKRRLKISIVHRDTGAIFHMVRYFSEKLDNNDVLEQVWCEWNRGSGKESQRFLNTQTRNLSVGDVVSIQEGGAGGPSKHYVCEAVGWDELAENPPRASAIDNGVAVLL